MLEMIRRALAVVTALLVVGCVTWITSLTYTPPEKKPADAGASAGQGKSPDLISKQEPLPESVKPQ
ncbi:MAG: hypothetical protein RR185_08475, partial [Angelakisella sp.]